MTYDGRRLMMKDNNEDDLKNKKDLYIGGRHTALDIFRFAVFFISKTHTLRLGAQPIRDQVT